MDQDKTPEPENESPKPEGDAAQSDAQQTPKKSGFTSKLGNKKLWITVLLIALLTAGLGWGGYQYQQKANRADELGQQVETLEQTVADRDTQLAELQAAPEGEAQEAEPADPCATGSSYTADVGNFTITLDDPYVIIRDLDAGFEGGPATRLALASCIDGETNVFDSPYQRDVNILANPQISATDLRSSYESQNGTLTADGTVDVDGVTADKYTQDALFPTTLIFFDRAGIGYQIEASGTPDNFNPLLNDLTGDWEFTGS